MDTATLEMITQLLEHYDAHLRDKGEHLADMMADWADASQTETIKYAQRYSINRLERQRVNDCLRIIHDAISNE